VITATVTTEIAIITATVPSATFNKTANPASRVIQTNPVAKGMKAALAVVAVVQTALAMKVVIRAMARITAKTTQVATTAKMRAVASPVQTIVARIIITGLAHPLKPQLALP
jgi:hypothetical protein